MRNEEDEVEQTMSVNEEYSSKYSILNHLLEQRNSLRRRLDKLDRKIELINKHPIIEEYLNLDK